MEFLIITNVFIFICVFEMKGKSNQYKEIQLTKANEMKN